MDGGTDKRIEGNVMAGTLAGISLLTLGVADLDRAQRFYEVMGWVNTPASQDSVRFMQGHNIVLGLFPRHELAKDANVSDSAPGFSGISLGVNLPDESAVDDWHRRALAAGANSVKKPEKVFWGGYSGYVADFDGHLWEVAHNPFFAMDEHGRLDLLGPES